MSDDVSTIKPGIVLQGDGGVSTGATILMNKMADEYTDVILCLAPKSEYDPFVVWTYNHARGTCLRGEYFNNLQYALQAYEEREH